MSPVQDPTQHCSSFCLTLFFLLFFTEQEEEEEEEA